MDILEFTRPQFDTAVGRLLAKGFISDPGMLDLLSEVNETPFEQLAYYLSEMSEETLENLNEFDFEWETIWYDDRDNIRIDLDRIPEIENFTMAVSDEHDSEGRDGELWNDLGLSSDDDADYNSGYINTAIELIDLYRAHQLLYPTTEK